MHVFFNFSKLELCIVTSGFHNSDISFVLHIRPLFDYLICFSTIWTFN